MPILAVVVQAKDVVLSVVAPKVADLDRVARAVKGVKAKVRTAIKAKKYIMASLLL